MVDKRGGSTEEIMRLFNYDFKDRPKDLALLGYAVDRLLQKYDVIDKK